MERRLKTTQASTPPTARRAARGCPGGAPGTCARRSRAPSAVPAGCRARPSPRAPRARGCPARSRPAATASQSKTRHSAPRSPRRRAASSSRRSRTRRRPCAAPARAPASRSRSDRHRLLRGDRSALLGSRGTLWQREHREPEERPGHRILEERVVEQRVAGDGEDAEPRDERQRPRRVAGSLEQDRADCQRESTSPTSPVSAATVTGVVCDAAFFGSLPLNLTRSAYARLNPPAPTPVSGWCTAMRIPLATRLERPLVTSFRPCDVWCCSDRRTCGCATESQPARRARARPRRGRASARRRRPHRSRRRAAQRSSTASRRSRARARSRRAPGRDERPAERPAADDEHDRRDHREHEKAPVHRRVPEDGVHAEERRIRVRVDHLRVLEDVPRLLLVEADDRERDAPSPSARPTLPQSEAAPRSRANVSASKRERDVEGEQLDRALVHVLAPRERNPGPAR